jgi:DNA-binding SARP family transcriptional activator/pimeloyl-ACP methyl ester carboxylesterase
MQIRILGPMEVRNDAGEACPPRGAKQRVLLATLLLHAPRVVSADRLIDALWGGTPPADPTGALRTQISRLRTFLEAAGAGPEPIRNEPWGYRLDVQGIELDSDRFEALIRASRSTADPLRELDTLTEALSLWRGRAWEEFADFPTFLGPARALEELHAGATERRIQSLLDLGRIEEALADAEALAVEDPLRERPRALLMQALHRAGRQPESLAAYQEFRRLLSDELGLAPSPTLQALHDRILRHEEGPAADPSRAGLEGDRPRDEAEAPSVGHPSPDEAPDDPARPPRIEQDIHLCLSPDGVRLAYACVGTGPPLVKAANWLTHLEFDWEGPVWGHLYRRIGAHHRLVRYDARGSGLSDRDVEELSLDAWVLDLETVVDAAGLDRFPLLGISQGCAVCIEYAARHPERVTGLVLHGGYAAGWRADPSYSPAEVARRDASIAIIRHGWGEDTPAYRQMFTQTFIPDGTPTQIEWFNELERRSTSPETAARFMEAFAVIDVRKRLPRVQAPTLILHSRGDQRIHYDRGRELAAGIPRSRFVLLESRNHLILEHEPAFEQWMKEATRFLTREVDG